MRRLARFLPLALVPAGIYAAVRQPTKVGSLPDRTTILPTAQSVQPAGTSLNIPGRPIDLALSPDGRTLYAKDNRGLIIADAETMSLRQELKFPSGGGSMHGLAVSRDGLTVYLTTAQNELWEAKVGKSGQAAWRRKIVLPGPEGKGASHPCGIALSPDGRTAYVCLSRNNALGVVDVEKGVLTQQIPVGVAPFDVALAPDGRTAWVSDWGGRRAKSGETTADSAGTPTLIDARGVARSGCVSRVDLEAGKEFVQVATGLHPSDLELSRDGRRLYVANANSDTVSVIDTAARKVAETISTRPLPGLPFGSMPNALTLSHDGRTLLVANGGNNALAVVAIETGRGKSLVRGFVPTGWFPGGVTTDGRRLFVACVKGFGSRTPPAEAKGRNVYHYTGTLQRVSVPDAEALRSMTAQVTALARIAQVEAARRGPRSGVKPVPVPERSGEPSVFRHVVYIIKENRTYDQVFGDIAKGDGDPSLCLYGRDVTPNHHALAETFALLDNYYCNGVLSADGHSWATEGNVTDHLEKSFGGFTRSYTFGDDPLTYSSTGFLWDGALKKGLWFRNYGEMDYTDEKPDVNYVDVLRDWQNKMGKIKFSHRVGIANLKKHTNPNYPGWNMDIPDVMRAEVFLKECDRFEREGRFPNLVLLYLPNDHATGTTPGTPTPQSYMADNDLALGRVVERLSKSKFWPQTCIFVNEDDPQDGFDHVDGHRSLCLVVSPYTRRGAVVSDFYNQTSVLHTIALMLGYAPMNQMDSLAPPMRTCFTTKPDTRPYLCLPNKVPLAQLNPKTTALSGVRRHWARVSQRQNFKRVDAADEDDMNRVLWHAAKGVNAPYPAHLAGAHGRGLKSRNLTLQSNTDAKNGSQPLPLR